jgi:hypothetical protein
MRDAQTQTNNLQTSPNYRPIQTVPEPIRSAALPNRTASKHPPTKRCKLYEDLGITRTEGAKLCAVIGLGRRRPLNEDEANCLSAIAKTYQVWKQAGHGIDYFISEYFN